MNSSDGGAYELVSSHAAQGRRARGLTAAAVSLAAGALALVVVGLTFKGGSVGDGATSSSRSLIRQRDALLGGPPAPKEVAPPARHTKLEVVNAVVRSQSLAETAPVRVVFDKEAQSKEIRAYVDSGHMKCCVRDNNDLEKEVYPKYYDDFPMDPVCIPGYRKDGDDCIACDAGYYCPMKEDQVLKCPPMTWAPMATGEVTDCWCAEGWYGLNPTVQNGADCHECPADKFCPGACSLLLSVAVPVAVSVSVSVSVSVECVSIRVLLSQQALCDLLTPYT